MHVEGDGVGTSTVAGSCAHQHVDAKATPMTPRWTWDLDMACFSGLVPGAAAQYQGTLLGPRAPSPALLSQPCLGLELDSGGLGHVPSEGGLTGMGT